MVGFSRYRRTYLIVPRWKIIRDEVNGQSAGGMRLSEPLPRLGEITAERLTLVGADFPGPSEGPPEVVDTLLAWPRHADWL